MYVFERLEAMKLQDAERVERERVILAMRENRVEDVAPGLLPDDFDHPLVANLIDTAAHDLAEVMAPLPTISCASAHQTSEKDKKSANKRTLIANSYVQKSRLADQMYAGADRYSSYGHMAYIVEPDYDEQRPHIRIETATTTYFACDYRDRVVQYATSMMVPAKSLCHLFPDHAQQIRTRLGMEQDRELEVATWHDKTCDLILLPEFKMVLKETPNPIGKVLVRMVRRPNLRPNDTRGQFDDVVWVQIARALTAAYTMSAVQQSVEAPIAMPDDVQELEMGAFATIQSKNPQQIGRVPLNIPQGLFPEMAQLAQEQRVGSRYPEGRSGNIDASIITGQGVQALMGTFDTQIQTFQKLNESALEDVISMCFEMDEKLWPEVVRNVRVSDLGSPVDLSYTPSRHIDGDYSVDASYGAVAGLDPNRSLIFLLQAVSGGFLSRETGRRHLPFDVDHVEETKRMDIEALRDAALGAVAALSQAIPAMAANGQDPRDVVQQLTEVMRLREKGKTIEEAVAAVFIPKEEEQAPSDPLAALLGGGAPATGAPPGPGGVSLPQPQSPGQDLLMGLAGLTPSGNPNLQANVSTRRAI